MTLLFNVPQTYDIPMSLGGDFIVTFKNKTPGSDPAEYIDFPNNVSIKMIIGKGDTATQINGVITGPNAVFRLESEVADTIRAGVSWRLIYSILGDTLTDDIVIMNGKVVRSDGD